MACMGILRASKLLLGRVGNVVTACIARALSQAARSLLLMLRCGKDCCWILVCDFQFMYKWSAFQAIYRFLSSAALAAGSVSGAAGTDTGDSTAWRMGPIAKDVGTTMHACARRAATVV